MKTLLTLILTLVALASYALDAVNLRCDWLQSPLAIENARPHLSWTVSSYDRGTLQQAYQILVASSPELLDEVNADLWNSGKTLSDRFYHVEYDGNVLTSFTQCYWKVRIWDNRGKLSDWSETATWTMGVLTPEDWQGAEWIVRRDPDEWRVDWQRLKESTPEAWVGWRWFNGNGESIWEFYDRQEKTPDAAPLMRGEFSLNRRDIKNATLYICGLGYFEACINGKAVTDDVLNPAWTQFDRTSLYCAYDVLPLLQDGANAIGVMIGRGQFAPYSKDNWNLYDAPWTSEPRLKAMIRLEKKDGSTEYVVTDGSWKTADGPMIFDDPRMGEIYDARLEQDGWSEPGFNAEGWQQAIVTECHFPLHPQLIPAVKRHGSVRPARTYTLADGSIVYDLQDNISGWAKVKVSGPAGSKVWIEYCELPADTTIVPTLHPTRKLPKTDDPQFALFYDSGTQVRQQNGYILRGNQKGETIECRFSYKGFRYVRVTVDEGVTVSSVEGVPVHSDLRQVGSFYCSDPTVNTLQQMSQKTLLNNMMSIPTDCPHREKQGWDADTYMTSMAAIYNFDMVHFYSNWANSLAQSQADDGGLHCVAPATASDVALTTSWPAAMTIVPLNLYKMYGEKRPLQKHFDVMARFAGSSLVRQVEGKPDIVTDLFGDWMSPAELTISQTKDVEDACIGVPPEGTTFYGSLFYFRVVNDMIRIARLTGRDTTNWQQWSDRIRNNFNREYFRQEESAYVAESETYRQAPNVMTLDFGLVPEGQSDAVTKKLIADIKSIDNRVNLGFLGAMSLMHILPDIDPELAFQVATQPDFPGWGYMAREGGITMWEDWAGKASHNHPPFCLISEYFYKYLAGIQLDCSDDGKPELTIKPQMVGGMTFAKGSYDSAYGLIESDWKIVGGQLQLRVTVPAGLTATVCIPASGISAVKESGVPLLSAEGIASAACEDGMVKVQAGSGKYLFQISYKNTSLNTHQRYP